VYFADFFLFFLLITLLQVAGLARRVHDVSSLKEKFDKLVQDDKQLDGDKRMLDRRVTTRWNTDLQCLDAHVYFKNSVQQLTAVAANKLQAYRLSDKQWELAELLVEVLEVSQHQSFGIFLQRNTCGLNEDL